MGGGRDLAGLSGLARRIDQRFGPLSERGRRVSLGAHRTLAMGTPVPDYAIAAATRLQIVHVKEEMAGWPGVVRDHQGRITGFQGLDLNRTHHSFEIDGHQLFTWCAWDALFLPELIGRPARVTAACAATGSPIELEVDATGARPTTAVEIAVSMADPECADVEGDRVMATFCHLIRFFVSAEAAASWAHERANGAWILSLAEAFELGRECNALRFGRALAPGAMGRRAGSFDS